MSKLDEWNVIEGGPGPGALLRWVARKEPKPTEEEQRVLDLIAKEVQLGHVRIIRPLTMRECIAQGCSVDDALDYLDRAMPHVVLWRGIEVMRIDPDKTEAAS